MTNKTHTNFTIGEMSQDNSRSRVNKVNLEGYKEDRSSYEDDSNQPVYDSAEKQKIINQNIKLKQQIFELSQQLEQILEKDRNRKRKLGPINPNDDDQTLRQKKSELKKQQLQILEMKNKIYTVKRQLEKLYNNRSMTTKQEKLRALKQQLRQLDQEKQGLLRIKNDQKKNIKNLTTEQEYQDKVDDLKKQLSKVKQQAKTMNEKVAEAEKILRRNHEQYISKQDKLRELQHRVSAAKERLKSKKPIQSITPEMINSLEEEISILEQERREGEKLWQQKIRAIDLEFEQKRMEEQKKLLILKEKEKEYRLNELKIKELRKLVRYNLAAESGKKAEQMDMSQFRHKRNIKHLQR